MMAVDVLNPVNMNCELLATCNALGYLEGHTYQKEPYCLETIKDLIRFLRREDETCSIRRQLGHAQILQNDLIPLIQQYNKEGELFETTIRLLVNLTQPADLCFQNVPNDKTFRNYFLEVLAHLQAYKQAFASEEFMAVLARILKKMLDMEWESRREDHTLLMERILLLVRNILHIPADPNAEKRTDDDASVHDQVLWALNVSGMDKLILYIASAEGEQQWCMHAVEIISHMLREQTPETVAKAGTVQHASERIKEEQELERLRQREMAEKRARNLKVSGRHSRFGGSFYMTNLKSISERDVIYHRPLHQARAMTFETGKGPAKKPKNRLPLRDNTINRRSTLSIRLFLKDFCILFLDNCYNPLMYAVKDHILHQRAQENDESYYLWAMHFFMQFSRHYKFRVDIISETFSVQAFHYVNTQIIKYQDMMTTDKKEAKAWSKRMHLGLKAYRELLATLNEMTRPNSTPELRESADVLQGNVFYVIEYREVFITLLKKFYEVTSTKTYLKDLIESSHIFIKMLEKYCSTKKTLIVQKKKKKKMKRRKRRQAQQEGDQSQNAAAEEAEQLSETWDSCLASELSSMLQGREDIPEDVVPFDAASEMPVEEQRADAMVRIQQSLRVGKAGEGLALFRAAREVWPEGDVFGAADVEPEDEFMSLREIHFTNLNVPSAQVDQTAGYVVEEQEEEDKEDEEDEMAMEEQMTRGEEEFNFKAFINKFSHPDVLRNYVKLLADYRTNTDFTNHCLVKVLHRVALDCDKTQLLFQLSLFRVFHHILQDPLSRTDQYKEMARFGQYVMGRFFKELQKNPKLVVETLFWKDPRGLYELQEGYGATAPSSKSKAKEWSEEEQAELAGLFEQYRDVDGEGKDVVDLIMEHLIDDAKTRRQIITQLVSQELIDSAKDLKKPKGAKRVTLWREEHELELRSLFDHNKDSNDVVGAILEKMTEKRSRNKVMQKILELGLVQDRKQLYKKRQQKADGGDRSGRKRRRRRRGGDDDQDGFKDSAEEDDEFADGLQEFPDSEAELSDDESGSDSGDGDDEEEYDENNEQEKPLEEVVVSLQKRGLTEPIQWIQECLRKTADDREASGNHQSIPVVPLSVDNSHATRKKAFKRFMKRVGLSEPRSHEEVYWRIPGNLTSSALRETADSIKPSDGIEVEPPPPAEGSTQTSEKSNARFEMLKQMALSRRKEKSERDSGLKKGQEAREEGPLGRSGGVGDEEQPVDPYDEETDVSGEEEGGCAESSHKPPSARKVSRLKRPLPSDSSDESEAETLNTFLSKYREEEEPEGQPAKRSRLVSRDEGSDGEPDQPSSTGGKKKVTAVTGRQKRETRLVSSDEDSDEERLEIVKEEDPASPAASPIAKAKAPKRSKMMSSDESDSDNEDDDGEEDAQSEIIEVVTKRPALPKKKPSPFDDSSDEDDEVLTTSEPIAMTTEEDTSPTHDQSLHLRLSSDSPSDADVTMKEIPTTETEEDEGEEVAVMETAPVEDNASNFKDDSTNNVLDDNVESNLDNKGASDSEAEVALGTDVEEVEEGAEGDWEEILDDDSDFDMTSSNQTGQAVTPAIEGSEDSDSDDDVPLRKIAKRKAISSDSEDE